MNVEAEPLPPFIVDPLLPPGFPNIKELESLIISSNQQLEVKLHPATGDACKRSELSSEQ